MKKFYGFLIGLAFLVVFMYSLVLSIEGLKSKYPIQIKGRNSIIETISSCFFLPIIEKRIDFYLKNSGIITELEKYKYDNKILKIDDKVAGLGPKILCGQTILLEIEENNKKTEKIVKVGTDESKIFNIAPLGMKKGGIRKIKIPAAFSERFTEEKNTEKNYTLHIKDILSYFPGSTENILIFEKTIGNERAVMCGDLVHLKYNIRDTKNTTTKSGNISFKLGEGIAPLGLELGVIEMVPGSKRTIIAPPDLLDSNFLQNQVNIIDLNVN